ncbi:hypothetical protein NB693_25435 [Pantoea ananatis]|uniref:hypothetical protein n=1 Tax=Pantoea ananas TaxID=553 RepID=UPI00221F439E|nr:hypothetical protein [Pantoea ananatis]
MAFYTYSVTGPKMIQTAFAGDDVMAGTIINLAALIVLMLMQPVGGWLSDLIGRKTLLVLELPRQSDWLSAFAILTAGFVILTGYTSINAVVKAELFPTHIRALGVGSAPLLYQASLKTGHVTTFVG